MNVKVEYSEGVAVLTIDRPKQLNALNTQVLRDLDAAITEIENNSDVRAVVLTGSGEKSFVAGADIAEMKDMSHEQGKEFGQYGNKVFRRLEKLNVPVIAAINGYALGGGNELAMACDIRIAAENALFAQPEVGLGIMPGFGGTQRLSRLVGKGIAMELILTGRRIDAAEALRIGLVNKVVPAGTALDEAVQMAKKIAKFPRTAVANNKRAVADGMEVDLDSGLAIESKLLSECFGTQEQKDLMEAFVNKGK